MDNAGLPSPSLMVPRPVTGVGFFGVAPLRVRFSAGSVMPSTTVGTRTTRALVGVLAGTATVKLPLALVATGAGTPAINTTGVLVSTPTVAVPLARVKVTLVAIGLLLLSVTAKSRFPPSVMVGLLMALMDGRSSVIVKLITALSVRPSGSAMV